MKRGVLIITLALCLPLFAAPLAFRSPTIEFNQFLVANLQLRAGIKPVATLGESLASYYAAGLNWLRRPRLAVVGETLSQPDAFFDYIFARLPLYIVAYPTEEFYYFSGATSDGVDFAGNVRLAELEEGRLSSAFFAIFTDPTTGVPSMTQPSYSLVRDVAKNPELAVRRAGARSWWVSWKGKTILAKLPDQEEIVRAPAFALQPGEEFVGKILDESGVKLALIYNRPANAFYDVLDETALTEKLRPLGAEYALGERSGFLYFVDQEFDRKLLVGVDQKNTYANNYLDGPADQVPIHLDLKELINRAYPSTLLGDSIDAHGVFNNKEEWVRIAIAPFNLYQNPSELIGLKTAECEAKKSGERTALWACLAREWWNTPEWQAEMQAKVAAQAARPV